MQENFDQVPTVESPSVIPGSRIRRSAERYGWMILLALILLLGAALRFTGVNWDDEQHLHPDERFLTMVSSSISLPDSIGEYFDTDKSPMNPYNKNYGSFVYGTAPLFIVRTTAEILNRVDPRSHTQDGNLDPDFDYTSYWKIYLVGRVLSALFDLLTCALVFAIGRRLFNTAVGLFAAFLYACAVLAIQQSHFMTVDAFGNVPIVLAFWFTLDIMEGKRGWLAFALAGAGLGLAVASRINFLMFAAIIVIAALLRLMTMLGSVKRISLAPGETPTRTYSMDAGAVLGDDAILGSSGSDELPARSESANVLAPNANTRTVTIGPLVIEIETKQRTRTAAADKALVVDNTSFWNAVFYVGTGLVICAFAALLIFRVGQPYAFKGLFGLNPKWLDDIKFISQLISGEIDYPPSHQWTGRAAYLFPLYNMFMYGMGIPFAAAAWAGFLVGVYEILRYRRWNHVLLMLWIGGFFLYQAQQFVLVIRYYLPIYPFLAIYAGFFVYWLWEHAMRVRGQWSRLISPDLNRAGNVTTIWNVGARIVVAALVILIAGYTAFWAAAFTSIYTRPVSRIVASDWLKANVPEGAAIANEHWDDPLPFGGYDGLKSSSDGLMQNYGEDDPSKRTDLQSWLDEADYIVLSSNRLYGSIPRLPRRYPLTTKYYEWLFSGQLGFDKIQEFTSYPQLFGIVINDDSSDEAFTVYDHPKVLVYKKSDRYSSANTAKLLNSVDLSELEKLKPIDYIASKNGFRMSPQLQAANYAGGTWSQIFDPNDLINQFPVVAWIVFIWALGILAFPYSFVAFRRFADRGYAFTKAVGILAFAWLTWTLASYQALPFERMTMMLVLALLFLGAAFVVWRKRAEVFAFLRAHWKLLIGIELVYLAFFGLDLAIRYGNPDLWHPWFGGEKPMDFAYLNAVIKSTYFPAYNPWFEGGFINYYYFGQLISAALVKFTGIVPEVAYNLLLPMFFGLTASGAFGVAYNLVARAASDSRPTTVDERLTVAAAAEQIITAEQPVIQTEQSAIGDSRLPVRDWRFAIRPFLAGIAAAVLVLIIGNLGQVGVLFQGLVSLGQQNGATGDTTSLFAGLLAWLVEGKEIPVATGNWYWTATRIIPDTINEFPFFTFVYADLHAHLMSLPFAVLGFGLAAHAALNRARLQWYDLGIAAMVLGALRAINTWDYPTYLAVIGCAMVIGYFADYKRQTTDGAEFDWSEFIQRYLLFIVLGFVQVALIVIPINAAGFKITFDMAIYILIMLFAIVLGLVHNGFDFDPRRVGWDLGWRMIALIALGVLFYWPYIANYGTAYTSVELWKDARTQLKDYLVVHGIFLFLAATYLVIVLLNKPARVMETSDLTQSDGEPESASRSWLEGWTVYLLPALAVLEIGLVFVGLHVFAVVVPLVAAAAWILLQRDTAPVHRFLSLILLAALLLTLMVEVVTLKGDIGRMNTVFKFYLQAWVFFAVASTAGLAIVFQHLWFRDPQVNQAGERVGGDSSGWQTIKAAWWGLAALLIFAGMLYPAFAGWAKVNDRFMKGMTPGLNGLDYMKQATYNESGHDITLEQDYQAIQWLRQNIVGTPVIVEGNSGLYHWGNRVSINTGLPVVIGWDWHTKQQYSLLPGDIIDHRIQDIRTIYESPETQETLDLLHHYNVSLVYVGPLERVVYNASNFGKFNDMVKQGTLQKVYDNDGVQIYALTEKVAQLVK